MSVATRPPSANGSRPDRLPRSQSSSSRGSEIRVGVLGVVGLVALVVGVPALLAIFVGYPLPRSAPTRDWLTTAISATLIIKILACVAWLVWAHFTVCLLSEWRAVRRGRLPSHVALGGGSQLLARRLVAAALLLSGAATAFSHSGAGDSGAPPRPPAAVAVQHAPAADRAVGPDQAGRTATTGTDTDTDTDTASRTARQVKYYTVKPPHGRRYDSLWDISERTLKDPMRYKEIFALNHDRTQSDGRKLIDANLILPGWELRLPADASGPGVHVAQAAAPQAPAPRAATPAAATPRAATADLGAGDAGAAAAGSAAPAGAAIAAPATTAPATTAPAASAAASSAQPADSWGSPALGGALMLGGLLVALTARRGPYGAQPDEQSGLGVAADPGLAQLLDRALRNLAADCAEQGRALPAPVAAWVSSDRIALNFAGGDTSAPPAPWRQEPGVDGSWECSVEDIADLLDPDVAAPFPGLLSVGTEVGYEVFVDFEQAPGIVSIAGDLDRGRELASALAVQAATSLWSDGAQVTVVGFGDGAELARIHPEAITQVPRLGDILDSVEREFADVQRLQRELGVDGVLTGRQVRRTDSWQPHVIVLSGPPTPDEAARLQPLVAGRSTVVAIVVGDTPSARWRFVLDAAGRIDLGALGASARAHRLGADAVTRLADLVTQAGDDRRAATTHVAALSPRQAVTVPAPAPNPAVPAAATVTLLGPVAVDAAGSLDDAKRNLLTEIAVAVAVHHDGVHDAVLRASIWPRGVSDEVCAAAMADTAAWLGVDSTGRPCLSEHDGRWHLTDAVHVDLHQLQRYAASDTAGTDELSQAIELFRGEAFSATPAGRYRWLAFLSAGRDARVLATAVVRRAAELFVAAERPAEAEAALQRGLALVPRSELMWRELLVLAGRRGGPEAAGVIARQMYTELTKHHSWPEPETDALVAQLAPDLHAARSA